MARADADQSSRAAFWGAGNRFHTAWTQRGSRAIDLYAGVKKRLIRPISMWIVSKQLGEVRIKNHDGSGCDVVDFPGQKRD